MNILQRFRGWFNQPTKTEQMLDGMVLVDEHRWDGYPTNAEECRREYSVPDGMSFMNVPCPACGDMILTHDMEVNDE